jgi:AcrR family transcriptional regulator
MTVQKRTAAETRAQIYAEARRLFNLKGYVGMTLREVAAGVGIEAQSLYNYTRSKQDLVASLMEQGTIEIQNAVDRALASAGPTPTAQLRAASAAHTGHYATSDQVVLVREGLPHLDDERRDAIMARLKHYEDTFKDILRRGCESGEFGDLDITPTCFAILGMGESVVNWYRPGGRLAVADVAQLYGDLAVRSVAAEKAPGDPGADPAKEGTGGPPTR